MHYRPSCNWDRFIRSSAKEMIWKTYLALTLAEETPERQEGEGPSFHWRWLGRGVLELTPTGEYDLSLLLSTGIHGNETAPVEIVESFAARAVSRRDHAALPSAGGAGKSACAGAK